MKLTPEAARGLLAFVVPLPTRPSRGHPLPPPRPRRAPVIVEAKSAGPARKGGAA